MRTIDLTHWNRRQHFELFRQADLPFYNINTQVDISGLKQVAQDRQITISCLLTYLTMQALNGIENFRYRLHGNDVIEHDVIHPSFTYLKPGEDLFRFITVNCRDDLDTFSLDMRRAIDASSSYFGTPEQLARDDLAYLSSLPWISFTGIDHTLSLKRNDAIPRITWGRFTPDGPRMLLPYNICVNHMFVDGLHVGRFFEALQAAIGSTLR